MYSGRGVVVEVVPYRVQVEPKARTRCGERRVGQGDEVRRRRRQKSCRRGRSCAHGELNVRPPLVRLLIINLIINLIIDLIIKLIISF